MSRRQSRGSLSDVVTGQHAGRASGSGSNTGGVSRFCVLPQNSISALAVIIAPYSVGFSRAKAAGGIILTSHVIHCLHPLFLALSSC